MMNCCVCRAHSGRMEICYECAVMVWPHRVVNHGAKVLAKKIMSVPDTPAAVVALRC